MKHYDYQINLFVDGELEENEREEMFTHLAGCKQCQALLSDMMILKEKSKVFCNEHLSEIKNKPMKVGKLYRIGFYASTAAAIILIFILVSKSLNIVSSKYDNSTHEKILIQNKELTEEEYLHHIKKIRTVSIDITRNL